MHAQRLPSILFVSASLIIFYVAKLLRRDDMQPVLPLFLQSFIRSPTYTDMNEAAHVDGHCYAIALDSDYADDLAGSSVLMMLEDGRPLPLPHALSVGDVTSKGGGRYLHVERAIYFSPSDNAEIRNLKRRYSVVETLTRDLDKIKTLARLKDPAGFPNIGMQLLVKLLVHLREHLRLDAAEVTGDNGIGVKNLRLDLTPLGFGPVAIGRVDIGWTMPDLWGDIDIVMKDIRADWLPPIAQIALSLGYTSESLLRVNSLTCDSPGHLQMQTSINWSAAGLREARVSIAPLEILRATLVQACGGAAASSEWLQVFLADIGSDALDLVDQFPDEARHALISALSPGSTATQLEVVLSRGGDSTTISCNPA